MPDLSFSQPERRNFVVPAVVALAIIGSALFYIYRPHRAMDAQVTHVSVVPVHTVFSSRTDPNSPRVVGAKDATEDDLYVLATVRLHDDLKLPLFIKDLTGTLTTADGTEITTSAVEKGDLDAVYSAFPSVRESSGPPLLREITIQPGATAEGMVMLHYAANEEIWKQRKSASVTVEFYHQDPITIPIPQ